jgi:hypothetical protein
MLKRQWLLPTPSVWADANPVNFAARFIWTSIRLSGPEAARQCRHLRNRPCRFLRANSFLNRHLGTVSKNVSSRVLKVLVLVTAVLA